MARQATVIVSDAHLGYGPLESAERFHRFLETVPALGDHLVINGDLFEFWFEYTSVIPRIAFPTLERLGALRRTGVRLTVVGGNHDRWGGSFWKDQLGAAFYPRYAQIELSGLPCFVAHGDGLSETRSSARVFHRVVGHPITRWAFRWIHPDIGMAIVRRMSPHLAGKQRSERELAAASDAQQAFAATVLQEWADVRVVVLAHTHVQAARELEPRRWYVNPGAWHDGGYYAVLTREGPTLHRFGEES